MLFGILPDLTTVLLRPNPLDQKVSNMVALSITWFLIIQLPGPHSGLRNQNLCFSKALQMVPKTHQVWSPLFWPYTVMFSLPESFQRQLIE